MTPQMQSLRTVLPKNPMKEPKADFKARLNVALARSCSAINAPKKGPMMTPQGPSQKQAIKPSVQPHAPYFVPPNFFTLQTGR